MPSDFSFLRFYSSRKSLFSISSPSLPRKDANLRDDCDLAHPHRFVSTPVERDCRRPLFSDAMVQRAWQNHSTVIRNSEIGLKPRESREIEIAEQDYSGNGISCRESLVAEENKKLKSRLSETEKELVDALSTIRAMKKSFDSHLTDKRECSRLVIESRKRENRLKGELYLLDSEVKQYLVYMEGERQRKSFEQEWKGRLRQPELHATYGCDSFDSTAINSTLFDDGQKTTFQQTSKIIRFLSPLAFRARAKKAHGNLKKAAGSALKFICQRMADPSFSCFSTNLED